RAFWILAWRRLVAGPDDRVYGDGHVMPATSKYYVRRLLAPAISPVSIDRSKAGLLAQAFRSFAKRPTQPTILNVMGHPKSLTPRGISQLGEFLGRVRPQMEPVTCLDYEALRPREAPRRLG